MRNGKSKVEKKNIKYHLYVHKIYTLEMKYRNKHVTISYDPNYLASLHFNIIRNYLLERKLMFYSASFKKFI